MEIKHGKYVWWGKSTIEKIQGNLERIEPSIDKNTGNQRKTEDGRPKYNMVLYSPEHNQELSITIIESQRVFWDKQLGKFGVVSHNPANNFLTFEEGDDPRGVQSTLADYDFDLVEVSPGEEAVLSLEVLVGIRDGYERELMDIKQRLSALNYAIEHLKE